ncbi:hypothetical protein [Agrobacterium vitis]|uniref:hypothetical protein n=1 Tax=Agrobacterium vitis TaxID=373 RepID=UPI0012E79332|nr:hypothetical protein [Agrobacterium vitis]MUZ65620.1 hypothetical protein [Agrobacterium vitis]
MGDAALWGGSSVVVGMAANPHKAHQAGRHMDQLHVGMLARMRTDGRVGALAGTPILGALGAL